MDNDCALSQTRPEDMRQSRAWTGRFVAQPSHLPTSFDYDGKTISGIPEGWNPVSRWRRIDANIVETLFEGRDVKTGLTIRVEWQEYCDYPVVEWTAWLTNQGDQPTPLIQNFLAIDASFAGDSPVLYHCNGDFYSEQGYTSQETPLQEGDLLRFAPDGGRPCDGAFPYYRVMFGGCGLSIAIGWPGQWSASYQGLANGVHIQAGQERTNLSLRPGESIRTPRIAVMSWTGDVAHATNLWRRWYLAHVLPRPNGRPLQPRLAVCYPGDGEEFTAATEANQLRNIEKFIDRGYRFDVWWIDAGWYPCYNTNHERRWWNTGTWQPDPERFPSGLKPVSERAAGHGADLLVWFEPERVRPGTSLAVEHPEWLIGVAGVDSSLLDLGNPQARLWLTDHISNLIQENGIKIYRQDFNFPPLEHWRLNEAPDRQGMRENMHVQGYLQYWDDLLRRNPGLWIDSCSSGGRRNDLETMRRSVPLHYTDYGYGIHPVKLSFQSTLYAWIPYFKESTLSWDLDGPGRYDSQVDSFSYHCALAPMLFALLDIGRKDYDDALAIKMIDIWRRASDLLLNGDYYPLTPAHRSAEKWVVRQFDRPETGSGFIQGIRLQECTEASITIQPEALCEDALYVLENPETGETKKITGSALVQDGFTFTLPKRSAAIWFYQKTGHQEA